MMVCVVAAQNKNGLVFTPGRLFAGRFVVFLAFDRMPATGNVKSKRPDQANQQPDITPAEWILRRTGQCASTTRIRVFYRYSRIIDLADSTASCEGEVEVGTEADKRAIDEADTRHRVTIPVNGCLFKQAIS